MSGVGVLVIGVFILILSTAGMTAAEIMIRRKKKRIREQVYHMYD